MRLAAVALAAWLGAASPGSAGDAAPEAVIAAADVDLGIVAVGEAAAHEFLIRNGGGAALTLRDARGSPGLRTAEIADPVIAPGRTGRVRVELDTWRILGPTSLAVAVATNDPVRPRLELRLEVDVRAFVYADPGYARYITVQGGREGTITQTVWAADGGDVRVTEVRSPYPHLRVAYREARPEERRPDAAGRQWRIEATLAADAPVGPLGDDLVVRLDHPRQKEMRIRVSGFVRPMFAVTPPAVRLGDVDPARPRAPTLLLKNFAEETAEVSGVTSDVPGIGAVVVPVEPGRAYRLRLTFSRELRPGPFAGTLRIRTTSPKYPFVDVPLAGRVLAPAPTAPDATGARP